MFLFYFCKRQKKIKEKIQTQKCFNTTDLKVLFWEESLKNWTRHLGEILNPYDSSEMSQYTLKWK